MALSAAACGGISERHDPSDAGTASAAEPGNQPANPTPAQNDTPSPDEEASCEDICEVCMAPALGESCQKFCGEALVDVSNAKCSAAFTTVLHCRKKAANSCAIDACPTEDNAFSACILEYCESHYMTDVCISPI